MIDAHCHLYEVPEENWVNNGLTAMICCGAGVESSKKTIELANKYPNVWATVGIHPEEREVIKELSNEVIKEKLRSMIKEPKVVAIGECGLDSDSDDEVELFKQNINLAKETGLPLVVHCRNQFKKIFEVLDHDKVQMHCFTGSREEMEECVKRGWYISFGGILTFKKSDYLREVAREVPEDRLLIETDSPYLAPEPVRGEKNTPGNVKYVAEVLAKTRGVTIDRIEEITTLNAKRLFGI